MIKKCKGKMCSESCLTCKHSDAWSYGSSESDRNMLWCKFHGAEVKSTDSCDDYDYIANTRD